MCFVPFFDKQQFLCYSVEFSINMYTKLSNLNHTEWSIESENVLFINYESCGIEIFMNNTIILIREKQINSTNLLVLLFYFVGQDY